MAARNLLHYNKLEEFKTWLITQGIEFRDGRGEYEVLQVRQPPHWVPVYRRDHGDHLTVQTRMVALVELFLKEKAHARHSHPLQQRPQPAEVQPQGGGSDDPPW